MACYCQLEIVNLIFERVFLSAENASCYFYYQTLLFFGKLSLDKKPCFLLLCSFASSARKRYLITRSWYCKRFIQTFQIFFLFLSFQSTTFLSTCSSISCFGVFTPPSQLCCCLCLPLKAGLLFFGCSHRCEQEGNKKNYGSTE